MAKNKDIKKNEPKKEKKKRKPIYEIKGFVLNIPTEALESLSTRYRASSSLYPKKG